MVLLTGPQPPDGIDPSLYTRLTRDTRGNGGRVIADLTGPALRAALAGGLDLLKISDEELVAEGFAAARDHDEDIAGAIERLHDAGAASALVSRGRGPSMALICEGGECDLVDVVGPRFEEVDHRGAGDSMFAAIGAMLAHGASSRVALRMGAAGALTVTRHGLGSGTRAEIERLAEHVTVRRRR